MARLHANQFRPAQILIWPWIVGPVSAVGLLLGVALLEAQVAKPIEENARQSAQDETTGEPVPPIVDNLTREGTEIVNQLGYFRLTADRVTFFTDDGIGRFVVLENLNLQRIARTITDDPEQLQWDVTGTVTEFRGANFLFVRRAILKARTQSSEAVF